MRPSNAAAVCGYLDGVPGWPRDSLPVVLARNAMLGRLTGYDLVVAQREAGFPQPAAEDLGDVYPAVRGLRP